MNLSDAVKYELSGNEIDIVGGKFVYILLVYIMLEKDETFSYLSADLKSRDNFFWTPLHHAYHCGQLDVVKLLLDNGADTY